MRRLKSKLFSVRNVYKALYGSEAWSLTLREERRLRVFENRIIDQVFGTRGKRMRVEKASQRGTSYFVQIK